MLVLNFLVLWCSRSDLWLWDLGIVIFVVVLSSLHMLLSPASLLTLLRTMPSEFFPATWSSPLEVTFHVVTAAGYCCCCDWLVQHWLELELWLHEDEDLDVVALACTPKTPPSGCMFDSFGWLWPGFEAENGHVPETFGEASSGKFE